MKVEVTGLHIYPVKSLRGIALPSAELTPLGLRHDRAWMLVNSKGGFVSQRQFPKMATIDTALSDSGLELSCATMTPITVPLEYAGPGQQLQARIWRDDCEVLDEGDLVADWLSTALDQPVRLVRMAAAFTRPQSKPERMGADTATQFADAAPLLVANEASLAELNSHLENRGLERVPMNRFRPNIIVRGIPAFAEHGMAHLTHHNFSLQLRDPCERCIMTTIDQSKGVKHPDMEPFNTLATLNWMQDKPNAPAFGENATLTTGAGQFITLGDSLEAEPRDR